MFSSTRVALSLILIAVFSFGETNSFAVDWDQNGVDDNVEKIWAERYKPSFFVNDTNPMEPEPVEILDQDGDGALTVNDLSCWVTDGAFEGTLLYEGDFCDFFPQSWFCNHRSPFYDLTWPTASSGSVAYPYFDYGGPGNENPDDWFITYAEGRGATRPGSAYDPKVYCHIFKEEANKIQIQYWYYYPYDSAYNRHEGDWEHISVILESDGQTEQAVFHGVCYYCHEFYLEISSMMTWWCPDDDEAFASYYPYMIDQTHPVVFVGGASSIPDHLGGCSGASWPCFGDFPLPGVNPEVERVYAGGPVLRYNEIDVEVIPNFPVDGPMSAAMTAWFESNPDKQWMRAELMWGYPIADSPLSGFIGANIAPMTPTHKAAWLDPYSEPHEGGEGIDHQICIRKPIVLVSAADTNDERHALEAGYSIQFDGSTPVNTSGTKIQELSRSQSHTVTVVMEASTTMANGSVGVFVAWSDGSTSRQKTVSYNPAALYPGQQVILDFHALYREAGHIWTEVDSQSLGLQAGIAGAWGDYDSDGRDDLFLLETSTQCALLRNTGSGFVEQAFPALAGESGGAAWGDCDNDGDLDLCVVPKAFGPFEVFLNNQGSFELGAYIGMGEAVSYAGCTWVDVDSDGDLDIVAYGARGQYAQIVLTNQGNGDFQCLSGLPRSMTGCAWADYDSDGDLDACALGTVHPGSPILNNDNGFFAEDSGYLASGWDDEVFSAAWIDYDNDGDLDFFQNFDLFERNGAGGLVRVFRFPIVDTAHAIYANWADFNADGWIDVIINGRLYRNDGGEFIDLTGWVEWPTERPGRWEWVDYDGDGDLDLFSFGTPLRLMENTENPASGFVRVDLQGSVSNRMGVGATCRFPNGLRPACQNSGVANTASRGLFGIGDLAAPYALGVTWPSGTRQSVQVPAGAQTVTVVEPTGILGTSCYPLVADNSLHDGVFAVKIESGVAVTGAAVNLAAIGVQSTMPLRDDGQGTDVLAGDGIYTSATFQAALDYYQFYYPVVSAELADGTHLQRRVDALLVSTVRDVLTIAASASTPLWATGTNSPMTLSVAIAAPVGQSIESVALDLSGFGISEPIMMTDAGPGLDGSGADAVAGDGVFSSSVFTANIAAGDYQVAVLARTAMGDVTHRLVAVEAVPYLAKLTNVSNNAQLGLNYSGAPYAAASSDYNRDQLHDLLIAQSDAAAVLFKETATPSSGVPSFAWGADWGVGSWRGAVAADYNNDGFTDLFLAHATNSVLWQNTGVQFGGIDKTAAWGLSGLGDVTAACWGDYDRDGWLDLYVVRSTTSSEPPTCESVAAAQHRLYRNCVGASGGFVDVTSTAGLGSVAEIPSLSAAFADIDQDGDLDLFVGRAPLDLNSCQPPHSPLTPSSELFINQGDGTFAGDGPMRFGASITGVSASAWADVNNDGYPDLLIAAESVGARVYVNDGNGYFLDDPIVLRGASDGYNNIVAVDQDLDGWQDVVLTPAVASRPVDILLNKEWNSTRAFASGTLASGLGGATPALGLLASDFSADGDPELFVGKPHTSGEFFYKTDPQSGSSPLANSYVKVRLKSSIWANNRQGVGAVVVVSKILGGVILQQQTQLVDGGSGRGGQKDAELVFGLGALDAESVQAKVVWPGGWVQYAVLSGRGETVNEIVDNTPPIRNASAMSTINPEQGTLNWVFSWETDVATDWTRDIVQIGPMPDRYNCLSGWTEVYANTQGVTHTYEPKTGGGYVHSITIPNLDCTVGCGFVFRVGSGFEDTKVFGNWSSKTVKICPAQF